MSCRLTGLGAIALAAIYCLRRRLIERNARARAARAFAALGGGPARLSSWVDKRVEYATAEADPRRAFFDAHGFFVARSFCAASECQALIARMAGLVEQWDPEVDNAAVFRTDAKQEKAQGSSDYFLDSADRIHFFTEVGAAAADGVGLRPSYRSRKAEALNKVGHALHLRDAVFRGYSNSAKLRELVGALGWVSPVVPQSMYIFKQAGIGGEVTSHQDSTFLFTTPRQTCLGLWLALEDATLTNGCLWVRPGSHHEPVRRAFVRQPQPPAAGGAAGGAATAAMGFEQQPEAEPVAWEGALPRSAAPGGLLGGLLAALRRLALGSRFDDLFAAGFVPVECRAGDLVCFPGTLDHLSLANSTGKSRHTFQLHLVEGPAAGVEWSPRNWLQYPTGGPPFHALGNLAPLAPLQKA